MAPLFRTCRIQSSQSYLLKRLRDVGFCYVRRFAVLPSLSGRPLVPSRLTLHVFPRLRFDMYTPYRMSARLGHTGIQTLCGLAFPFWYRDEVLIAQRSMPQIEHVLRDLFQALRSVWQL